MTDKNSHLKQEGDPAEFLLSTTKYHDCFLTVGDPAVEQVERIGVSSTQLIAHSTVFRDLLADSQLSDPSGSNTHIADVSPATFKLMLRHVYGCKLPKMTRGEATNLALCADKYNIQRLVEKAAKQIRPTSAENVYPALLCVAYINCPALESQVSTIIQQETDRIVQNPIFLQLDENCLLFIVKQNVMNINELQLWKSLVLWGENQVEKFPEKTLRNCLNKVLRHVRLLSLTTNQILKHVLPTKILTPDEFVDLTLAVSKTETLQSPGLCRVLEKRRIYRDNSNKEVEKQVPKFNNIYSFNSKPGSIEYYSLEILESKVYSTLIIKPSVAIKLNSFTVKSMQINGTNNTANYEPFILVSKIVVYMSSEGILKSTDQIMLKRTAVPSEDIILELIKFNKGQSLILEPNLTYTFKIQVSPPLPVHKCRCKTNVGTNTTYRDNTYKMEHFTLKFEDPFHILNINYSV